MLQHQIFEPTKLYDLYLGDGILRGLTKSDHVYIYIHTVDITYIYIS